MDPLCDSCGHGLNNHTSDGVCLESTCSCFVRAGIENYVCTLCQHSEIHHIAGRGCVIDGCKCLNWGAGSPEPALITSVATCVRCEHPVSSHEAGRGCTEIGCDDCFLVPSGVNGGLEKMPFPGHASDPVNHPSHYTRFGAEVIEITEHLNFCRGNAVKYISRAGLKDPETELEDLEKALWYLTREINRMKKEK